MRGVFAVLVVSVFVMATLASVSLFLYQLGLFK